MSENNYSGLAKGAFIMRWTGWIFVVAVIGLAGSAAGYQPGCVGCSHGTTAGPWSAEACASPAGYALAPGCCEPHRRCCDNAWAGYCDHRARVEAFWSRVGTPAAYARSRPCRQAPMVPCTISEPCSVSDPVMQPTPTEPTPAPMPAPPEAPSKTSWNVYNRHLR